MTIKVSELAIDIRVDGLPEVQKAAAEIDTTFQQLAGRFSAWLGPAALAGAAAAFVQIADQANLIDQRLASAVGQGVALRVANEDVFRIAQASAMQLGETANLYARLKAASKDFGASQAQVAVATQAVADAFRLGGASAQESAAAAQQLGQALGKGVLNGDELRSILENSRPLAEAIAREFGVSVGKLKEMGENGQLVADKVFQALITASSDFRDRVEELPTTVEQALTRVGNAYDALIARIDRKTGTTSGLSSGLNVLADILSFGSTGGDNNAFAGALAFLSGDIGTAREQARIATQRRDAIAAVDAVASMYGRTKFESIAGRYAGPNMLNGGLPSLGRAISGAQAPITFTPGPMRGGAIADASPFFRRSGDRPFDWGAMVRDLASVDTMGPGRLAGAAVGGVPLAAGFADVTAMIAQEAARRADEARNAVAEPFADALAGGLLSGITGGIARAVESGDIGEGFKQLSAEMAGSLGMAMIDFGQKTLITAELMARIRDALGSLLPGGSKVAAAAMIAAGAAMVGIARRNARRSFGGRDGFGSLAQGALGSSGEIVERGVIGVPSSIIADGRDRTRVDEIVGMAARAKPLPAMQFTIIGDNDPTVQRTIGTIVRKELGRFS